MKHANDHRTALAVALCLLAAAPTCATALTTATPGFVWGGFDSDTGQWALQTGTTGSTSVIQTDNFAPYLVEFNPDTQTLYWSYRDFVGNGGAVRQIQPDGTGFQSAPADLATGIALDPANNALFVTEQGSDRITLYNADLSTPSPLPIFTQFGFLPGQIDLDSDNATLYFHNSDGSQAQTGAYSIESISTTGNNRQVLLTGLIQVTGLALDLDAGKVYWADLGVNGVDDTRIERMNLDGSGREAVLENLSDVIIDMQISTDTGRVYWTARDQGQIKSATLDGLDVQTEVSGLTQPHGLALIPEPTSLLSISLMGLTLLRRRRP